MRASCLLLNNSFSSQLWPANTRLGGDSSTETQRPIIRSVSIRSDLKRRDSLTRPFFNPEMACSVPVEDTLMCTSWRSKNVCRIHRLHRNSRISSYIIPEDFSLKALALEWVCKQTCVMNHLAQLALLSMNDERFRSIAPKQELPNDGCL